jgi:hypothetical protein
MNKITLQRLIVFAIAIFDALFQLNGTINQAAKLDLRKWNGLAGNDN